jgi:phage terminase large subunit-like protein
VAKAPRSDTHVAKAEKYIDEVLSGRVPACKWVRLACERQRNDLARKNWKWRFDAEKAERVCRFIELLPHSKGEWAARRERIKLEPWQCFILTTVFGWVGDDGKRRYQIVYIEVPRKSGKSAMSAGVGLYMLAADGEHGAEVYSGATTEKQAWEVFRPAKLMASGTPDLVKHFGIEVNASNIHILGNGSRFEPLIGKPGDGSSPSCAIIDEFHEHLTPDQRDTMRTGMGARTQPLLWIITTAGDNLSGPCYDERLTVQKILERSESDDRRFGAIWTIDEADDWTSEDALKKANPNYGVSISSSFLRDQQKDAIRNSRNQGVFKTKHLNVWVQARAAAFNMERWAGGYDASLNINDFRDRKAYIGIDLASEVDIAAVELVVEDDGGLVRFGRHYLPEETVSNPKNKHYQAWEAEGRIVVTDGSMIDFQRILEDIQEFAALFNGVDVAYDPFQATFLVTQLMAAGISCTKYPQQVMTMSPAMKRLDALIMSGKFRHGCDERDPMTWMMSNVTARVDAKDNIYPRKDRPENKIDGPVALMMAIGRTLAADEPVYGSIYDDEATWGEVVAQVKDAEERVEMITARPAARPSIFDSEWR